MVADAISAGERPAVPVLDGWAQSLRRFGIGLFLIAAFVVTGGMLLLIVTAEQLQTAVAAPEFASLKVSTGWVRQDVAYLEEYWKEMRAISQKEDAAEEELFRIGARDAQTRAAMSSAADDARNFIDLNDTIYIIPPLKLRAFAAGDDHAAPTDLPTAEGHSAQVLQPVETGTEGTSAPPAGPVAAEPTAKPSPSYALPAALGFGQRVDQYFDNYYTELETLPDAEKARQALNAFKIETYKRLTNYFAARAQYDSDASTRRALEGRIVALKKQAAQLDADSQKPETALANGAYWSLAEDFLTFKALVGDFAYNVVALPRMMLVLLISIFMGILGSLIYITMDFYRSPEERGFWNIVFRIGLGAGVAFALFFFAAAGMLALAQTKSGAQSDMSPYLIAFLGITGGYLSDRVTQWMREVGENAFKVKADGPPDRWAIDLGGKLAAAGLDNAALASTAGATVSDADAWVTQTRPVPGDKQAVVAAFLRMHPSQVFTDIPPG